jgi:hypothetical protein
MQPEQEIIMQTTKQNLKHLEGSSVLYGTVVGEG